MIVLAFAIALAAGTVFAAEDRPGFNERSPLN
jgi:hypothetical protein